MAELDTNVTAEVETEAENKEQETVSETVTETAELAKLRAEMAKQKAALDKVTKEAGDYKKQLRAKQSAEEIAAQIEREAVAVLLRLRAASCDAAGFGRIAIRKSIDIPAWEKRNWPDEYDHLGVRVSADVRIQ